MWGHHSRSGALMALTEHGAVKACSFKKVPESDRFVASELEKLKGLPWNRLGSWEESLVAGPDAQGIPILPAPTGMPPLQPKMQDRRMYDGGSEGCQACTQVYTFGRTNVTHSDACRRRIQELMKGDDVGRARLDASRKRKASSQAFERDAPPMPRVGHESGPDNQLPVQEESTRHEGDDRAEIPAAQGSGDPDQSRMDMSEGAASSSGQGSKRTASQAGLPEDVDVSNPQGYQASRLGNYRVWSGARCQETENCGRNYLDNKERCRF